MNCFALVGDATFSGSFEGASLSSAVKRQIAMLSGQVPYGATVQGAKGHFVSQRIPTALDGSLTAA